MVLTNKKLKWIKTNYIEQAVQLEKLKVSARLSLLFLH